VPELFRLLEEYFWYLFIFSAVWVVAFSVFFAWRRYASGPTHPPIAESDVQFVERYASGFSHKNYFTRLGGARNALVVKVLKDGVLIEPIAMFKWIMPVGFNDLEHFVSKSNITRVETAARFGRDSLRLEFRGKDGAPKALELILRKPQDFMAALKA
jgi:hypothetical protein